MAHDNLASSDWVRRWTHVIPQGGTVLDLACGHGRHLLWLDSCGLSVLGVDRDAASLASAAAWGSTLQADLEQGPWPLTGRTFAGVVVTHYLWRPTWPLLLDCLAPGGVLIYETFSRQHAQIGKPSRDDFLLLPGELREPGGTLHVVAYADGFFKDPARFAHLLVTVGDTAPQLSPAPAPPLPRGARLVRGGGPDRSRGRSTPARACRPSRRTARRRPSSRPRQPRPGSRPRRR